MRALRLGLVLAAVVAAAIAVNVTLLSLATASHEPVGQLSPVVAIQPAAGRHPSPLAPPPAPPPLRPAHEGEADD